MSWRVDVGDCVELMAAMPASSVDAVVCDPPYGLEFMGKEWDRLGAGIEAFSDSDFGSRDGNTFGQPGGQHVRYGSSAKSMQEWHHRWATEALRVLKPGGHLLAFGGTRTSHRLACAIEDAGFEIRDTIVYLYGSGFPKSLNVGCRCPGGPLPYSHADTSDVLGVRDNGDAPSESRGEGEESLLRLPLQRDSAGPRMGEARLEGHGGPEADAGHAGREESGMEGRRHLLSEEGELPADQIRASASVGVSDGPEGRLRDGASATDGSEDRTPAHTAGSGTSPRPRPAEQRPGESGALADERGAQDGRGWPYCSRCGKPAAGLGTALKPAHEPIVVARKPLAGTVAANVLEHGTGGLNVDSCRVGDPENKRAAGTRSYKAGRLAGGLNGEGELHDAPHDGLGRWPANVVLDEQAATMLDQQSGELTSGTLSPSNNVQDSTGWAGGSRSDRVKSTFAPNSGGASRFFYTAKASRAERNAGLDGFEEQDTAALTGRNEGSQGLSGDASNRGQTGNPRAGQSGGPRRNHHPTVKPVSLMRWLCRLVTPPGGLVLDPFTGSGTTGIAAVLEGFDFAGLEQDGEYAAIARARIGWWDLHGHDALRIVAEQERAEAERDAIRQSGQMDLLA